MAARKKIDDDTILEAYRELGSMPRVARKLGVSVATVHRSLQRSKSKLEDAEEEEGERLVINWGGEAERSYTMTFKDSFDNILNVTQMRLEPLTMKFAFIFSNAFDCYKKAFVTFRGEREVNIVREALNWPSASAILASASRKRLSPSGGAFDPADCILLFFKEKGLDVMEGLSAYSR